MHDTKQTVSPVQDLTGDLWSSNSTCCTKSPTVVQCDAKKTMNISVYYSPKLRTLPTIFSVISFFCSCGLLHCYCYGYFIKTRVCVCLSPCFVCRAERRQDTLWEGRLLPLLLWSIIHNSAVTQKLNVVSVCASTYTDTHTHTLTPSPPL